MRHDNDDEDKAHVERMISG